jgi:hypothetical protein
VIDKKLQSENPDAPWMWNQEWAEGRIHSATGSVTILTWVMALLWNGFAWPVLLILWGDPEKATMVKVVAIFAFVGVLLLFWAIRNTLGWFRFGTSTFEPASNPGVIGGVLEGRIQTRLKNRPEAPVQIALKCSHRVTRRERRSNFGDTSDQSNPKDRTVTTSELLYQTSRRILPEQLSRETRGLAIPVSIKIPYEKTSTDISDPNDQITWTLAVSADLPGVDYDAAFPVPVFVTDDSDPDLTQETIDEAADRAGQFSPPEEREASWVPPLVVRWTAAGGVEYTFRPATSLKAAVGVSLLTIAVCAGSALLWVWLDEAGPFAIIPGVFGFLLLLATAVVWTFTSRVRIEQGVLSVRKSLLGIPLSRKIPFSDIKAIRVQRDLVEGLDEEDLDWEIIAELHSEEDEVSLGASFASRTEAVRIAEEMDNMIV